MLYKTKGKIQSTSTTHTNNITQWLRQNIIQLLDNIFAEIHAKLMTARFSNDFCMKVNIRVFKVSDTSPDIS